MRTNRYRLIGAVALLLTAALAQAELAQAQADAQRVLNEGYSLLYSDVKGVAKSDLAFLVKIEADAVQASVEQVADYCGQVAQQLEKIAKDDPAIRLDLEPLPEMERRKRAAVTRDRLLSFAPLVGRTGPDFERTLLLSLSGALNQLRHTAAVMADAETDPSRREYLKSAGQGFDKQYDQVVVLLNERYFKHNTYQPD